MVHQFEAAVTVRISASTKRVWKALTDPALVKEYLFGTEMVTDGKVGSPIVYRGTWEGKHYEDKGTILESEPEKRFVSTYWSSMRGLADLPENYNRVAYQLHAVGGVTELTVAQDNFKTEEERKHSLKNWHTVLDALKKVAEVVH